MTEKYLVLGLYFSTLLIIGFFAAKRIRDSSDYFVGGKKLGFWVVAFSSRATGESAWLLLGLTGAGAVVGINALWIVLGEVLGVGLAWFVMARPFKRLTNQYQSLTIPDYLSRRFRTNTHTLRIVAATVLSVFVTIYVSAQIDATGSAFEAFLGVDYYLGAVIGFLLVLAYIFMGGFVAVAWSDLFQGLLMLLGLVLLPLVAWTLIDDPPLFAKLREVDPTLFNIWGVGGLTLENIFGILGFLMIGLGFLGSPQLFVRFMAIKSEIEIRKGRWVAIAFTVITDVSAVLVGLIGRYYFDLDGADVEQVFGSGGQNVLSMLVNAVMPPLLIGLFIAVVLSAIMSTIDSLLIVASSAISRDYYQQVINPNIDETTLTRISKWITVAIALIALALAMLVAVLSPERTIFWFVIFGWSGIAATFCPMIILSLFWKRYTEKGAIASMLTGLICIPVFKFGATRLPEVGVYFEKMDVMLPSFLLAMIAGILTSKLYPIQHSQPQ